jgi:hypothetical protein
MTNAEKTREFQEAEARFYAWEVPESYNPFQTFRCRHIEPYPIMSEAQCRARAGKPELFEAAGCSLTCPRWKYYRKLAKKEAAAHDDGITRKAYPVHRSQSDE